MGTVWFVVPLAVAGVGFLLFLAGIGHLARGRAARAGIGLAGGGTATVAGLVAGFLGLNMQSYSRLTYEAPVADIAIRADNPSQKLYTVTVHRLDGTNRSETCTLQGDEWLLSGRVQKWKPWANELGLNATYTLNQISNMYYSAEEANGKPITACDITGPAPKINQYLPEAWVNWLIHHMLVRDHRFGSANFMPLADGAVYKVVITQFGFNAEPVNDAAKRANDARP
ncbi:MAG: hypothetical protein KGJ79_11020 [Alphaproteobacteria bacterium]|nr:hypothetical protein [Alphaproteobacteria bacterium]MDE2111662.1 hypothetical protein [Alphaproteobacteria bacterium]MDE2492818.1 hypothetical protein [Alphaproteobacteria bacterium]